MAKTNLVIVESPAKAKTIGKYLGGSYTVKASMGHVRDLPKSKLGINLERDFQPEYQMIPGKEDLIEDLRKAASRSERVFLATDPDREGEAISWHLKELLQLPEQKICRVTFHEITRRAVEENIAAPRGIDQNLVNAQQARRVLDRIVGYQLSPLLWKKIRRGLSAGRVQSVATRLVVEREDEIEAFTPKEYWQLDAVLSRVAPGIGTFSARFQGTRDGKLELTCEAEARTVSEAVRGAPFLVDTLKRADKERNPAPPFITSTLQQEASRRLGMAPRRAMSVAQQLYEGVEITGEGAVGLITYMRTDSLRLSDEAISAARAFIRDRYGAAYCPAGPRRFKSKSGAQDAHEAIRPSDVRLTPEDVKKDLTAEQFKLYRLIWSRFVACQMSAAVYDSVTVDVSSAGYVFRASASAVKFSGFTAVYEEGRDDERETVSSPLPALREGETLQLTELKEEQLFTQPPPRFTEATLIRALEDRGVGRPSTYAPTISTIMDREYVIKEGKNLRPTPLGKVVTGLMKEKFTGIVDPDFTAQMEKQLDNVEAGNEEWTRVLGEFYGDFARTLQQAETDLDGERIRVPDEVSDEVCDLCGKNLVFKSGRFGRFLACPGWPDCSFTKPITLEMPGRCPNCGGKLLKRTSKRGFAYYGCEKGAACGFMTWDVPVKEDCPACGHTMFKRSGRGHKRPYCINSACERFLPEDQRGYRKKTAEGEKKAGEEADAAGEPAAEGTGKKPSAKKTAAAKGAGKKAATAKSTTAKSTTAKSTAAKSTTAKSTTAKSTTAKSTTAKSTTAKRTAAKSTAAKKAAKKAAGTAAE